MQKLNMENKPERPSTPPPQPMLKIGADDLYKGTTAYQFAQLENAIRGFGWILLEHFKPLVIWLTELIHKWLDVSHRVQAAPINPKALYIYWNGCYQLQPCKMLAAHCQTLEDVNMVIWASRNGLHCYDALKLLLKERIKTPDGLMLEVKDAPVLEIWRDGLCFDEYGACIGSEDKT